jgi:outer membrane lipoprotein-sorting protein
MKNLNNMCAFEPPLKNGLSKVVRNGITLVSLIAAVSFAQADCFAAPAKSASKAASPSANNKKLVSSLSGMTRSAVQDMTNDGQEFLKEMSDAANNVSSYSFISSMTVFKNGKTIQENSKFYFKKPRCIRAEELGPYKKGSVAVLLKNGKVKGHLGGLLSKFSGTVDADSDWVQSANGYPLVDSDYYSMSKVMLDFANKGKKTLVTQSPVTVTGQSKPVYVLEMYTDASKQELMKRAYIDPQNLLPVEWFDYKDGKLFAHTLWKDLKLNVDLDDSLFNL